MSGRHAPAGLVYAVRDAGLRIEGFPHTINFQHAPREAVDDPGVGGTMLKTNTTEIGTARLPRRSLTLAVHTDVSPSAQRRPASFPALALAVLAVVLALAAPAAAQTTVTLVSNVGQTAVEAFSSSDRAQAFTTGSNAGGYTLSSVDLVWAVGETDDAAVSVCTTAGSGFPTATCTAFTAPGTFAAGTVTFTASPAMTLAKETTYTVVVDPGGDILNLGNTAVNEEDSGGATGWSIADAYHFKNSSDAWQLLTNVSYSLQITLKGTIVSSTTAVPTNWGLKPTSLTTGDQFRLLFLSSTSRNVTPTDIATYNSWIQARAAAAHTDIQAYSAGFRVVGCTDDDARDNTSTTYTSTAKGVPIYWLDGTKVADQYEDFYDINSDAFDSSVTIRFQNRTTRSNPIAYDSVSYS